MGYDLVSIIQSVNPLNQDEDPEAYAIKDFELYNDRYFNGTTWYKLLKLAFSYGWRPLGTLPGHPYFVPNPDDWDPMDYLTNSSQVVTGEDAAALAIALESALDVIPDTLGREPKMINIFSLPDVVQQWADVLGIDKELVAKGPPIYVPDNMFSPLDYFAGEGKEVIVDFIAFCRKGGFWIS
jgi:hypothetical protein